MHPVTYRQRTILMDFDFSSSNNVVLSNTVVKNQDDCVAVTSGENITVTGMTCSGGQ